jgi:hypothetical protein
VYVKEIGDESLKKWKPRDVILEILLLDPHGDKTATLSMGRAPVGEPGESDYVTVGTDQRLNMKWTNKSYNILGSYLHSPTLYQMEREQIPDPNSVKSSVGEILSYLENILSKPIFRMNFGAFIEIDCTCGQRLRQRVSVIKDGELQCRNKSCGAIWEISELSEVDRSFSYKIKQGHISCRCGSDIYLPLHTAKPGRKFECPTCKARMKIDMGVFYQAEPDGEDNGGARLHPSPNSESPSE